jgi:hypothetical protein
LGNWKEVSDKYLIYIFFLLKTSRKDVLHFGHSHKPISSCIRFPALSGLPAIFQDFLGVETSVAHFGHFPISIFPRNYVAYPWFLMMGDKKLSIMFE